MPIGELRVDGGPTRNAYLMQTQSDLLDIPVRVPDSEELSGIGAACMAGIACGLYDESVLHALRYRTYERKMDPETRERKTALWRSAVGRTVYTPV